MGQYNPAHPRSAECRQEQEQRLRRDTSTRGLSQIRPSTTVRLCTPLNGADSSKAREDH